MIDQIITFVEAHKAADSVAVAWMVRETPLVYTWIRDNVIKIYPYVNEHGGLFRVVRNFFWVPDVVATTQQTNKGSEVK